MKKTQQKTQTVVLNTTKNVSSEQKVEKVEKFGSIAKVLVNILTNESIVVKDRADLKTKMYNYFGKHFNFKYSKGTIQIESIKRQIPAMFRDFKMERKGWWAEFELKEDENRITLRKRKKD